VRESLLVKESSTFLRTHAEGMLSSAIEADQTFSSDSVYGHQSLNLNQSYLMRTN